MAIMKECNRCRKMIPYGNTYCDTCKPIAEKERQERLTHVTRLSNRRYNRKRDPKYIRFYKSKEWRMLSLARLQKDRYKCVRCNNIASEVDHIIPIQTEAGWAKRLDYNNTQSLCTQCHNAKHQRFMKRE